jgi:hypothetical protein
LGHLAPWDIGVALHEFLGFFLGNAHSFWAAIVATGDAFKQAVWSANNTRQESSAKCGASLANAF